ncbi:hypothetical protein V6N13_068885 [Hibiscus sabdariffa]|uniref:Uncharacterized protein n=1 Tax=Hibiscus sabdariffa TaxID=183260 RepID=A0ABR2QNY9_9ROSI
MQIASLGEARRQGGSSKTFVQVSIPEKGYRYPFVETPGIDTWGGVSVPKSPLELEYRYWLPSTDTSCLKTVFGTPLGMILCVWVLEFVMYDSLSSDDVLTSKLHT